MLGKGTITFEQFASCAIRMFLKAGNGERGMGNPERESGNEWSAVSY